MTLPPSLELELTWLGHDGTASGPTEAGVVHVPGGLPGDRVRAVPTARRGRRLDATLDALLAPSPHRITPPCPWDARCGGCDLSALDAPARGEHLGAMLAQTFGWSAPVPVTPSPRPVGHRARISLAIDGPHLGYREARSHALVQATSCRIARPELQPALDALRAWLTDHPATGLRGAELRTDGDKVVTALTGSTDRDTREALASLGHVALEGRALHGDPVLHLPVGGLRLRASPRSFFQVNLEANEALVAYVGHQLRAVRAERVLDLYAGIGNLGLPLAAGGLPVVAVEQEGQALHDLRATAAAHGLAQVHTLALAAERFEPSREAYDAAILDPPRAGAGEVLARVLRNRPRRVVYVSCFAPAAARDLRQHAKGYRLTEVRGFDLFPDTHHVEAVLTLDRV